MGIKIREMAMPQGKYSIKCPYSMTATRIVVHNTTNDASAENEIKYMQSNGNQVSFHFAVDDKEIVQGIPLERNAWHAGDGGAGIGNRQGIAIEICYSKSGGARFKKAEKLAAKLIAKLLTERKWNLDRVTKHQDYSGKYCPHRTLDMGWERFLKLIKREMEGLTGCSDEYARNGLSFSRAKDFSIKYFDKDNRQGNTLRYINGGFFGYFKSENGINFTLPVANLVCDCTISDIPDAAHKYLDRYLSSGKLWIGCGSQSWTNQFRDKKVSTLVVPLSGKPYVVDTNAPPANCRYAISGVPTVRNGDDVDYYNYVAAQGWDESCMGAAYRNWLGIRDDDVWIITGKTEARNYIYGMEFWNKISGEGFNDIICLDGGGSYYYKNGSIKSTSGGRAVNNIVLF